MEFGLDSCAKCTFIQGKTIRTDNISFDESKTTLERENEVSSKYLGIEEGPPDTTQKNA